MIVDSSALAEQVVADVLQSSFDSAGQRCSALRVLCLQDEVADRTLDMLTGAMNELAVGNPDRLSADVGPVIDADAKRGIDAHIAAMRDKGRKVVQLPMPQACAAGTFVPPTLIELDSIDELKRESIRAGAARRAVSPQRTRQAARTDSPDGLRLDARHPYADRRDDCACDRPRACRQHLCEPQCDRRGGRCAAVRRRRFVGHGPEGGRRAVSAASAGEAAGRVAAVARATRWWPTTRSRRRTATAPLPATSRPRR